MGLTLDELKFIKKHLTLPCNYYSCPALKLIDREIKLKETDFVRMRDAQGNPIPNEGE